MDVVGERLVVIEISLEELEMSLTFETVIGIIAN